MDKFSCDISVSLVFARCILARDFSALTSAQKTAWNAFLYMHDSDATYRVVDDIDDADEDWCDVSGEYVDCVTVRIAREAPAKCDTYNYTVAVHFSAAILYDDLSALSDDECDMLEGFVTQHAGIPGYWELGPDAGFDCCDITGSMAECVIAQYVIMPN